MKLLILFLCFLISCENGNIYRLIVKNEKEMLNKHSEYYEYIYMFNNFYYRKQMVNINFKNNKFYLSTKLYKPDIKLIKSLEFSIKVKNNFKEYKLKESKKKILSNKIVYYKTQTDKILIYPIEYEYLNQIELLHNDTIILEAKYLNNFDKFSIDTILYIFKLKDSINKRNSYYEFKDSYRI